MWVKSDILWVMNSLKISPTEKILVVGVLVFVALIFAGHQAHQGEDWLFVQDAELGRLTPVDASQGIYQLVLTNADPKITFFADRPAVDVGNMSVSDLFEFLFDPDLALPNGALVVNQGEGKPQLNLGFEFQDGSFDSGHEPGYLYRAPSGRTYRKTFPVQYYGTG